MADAHKPPEKVDLQMPPDKGTLLPRLRPTVRDISDSCAGLRGVAERLREAAQGRPLEGYATSVVPTNVSGLQDDAQYIDSVVEELRRLIPEGRVKLG